MTDGGELIPLRTGFDVVLRGYRRRQVREYVRAVEEELRLVAADRDANAELADTLTTEVEHLRAENARLAHRLDEVCRTPVEPDAVPARLRRMVELAQEEATEITRGHRRRPSTAGPPRRTPPGDCGPATRARSPRWTGSARRCRPNTARCCNRRGWTPR